MKKLYFLKSRFVLVASLLCGVTTMLTSCVNSDYDFDKEIDMEMNLGGSFTIPLGTTKQITLEDMLDPSEIDMLEVMENGDYVISTSDEMEVDLSELSDLSVSMSAITGDIDPIETALEIPEFPSFSLTPDPQTIEVSSSSIDVDSGDAVEIRETMNVIPELSDEIVDADEGYTIEPLEIPIELESSDIEIDITLDCPSEVAQISNIEFESEATITIDVTNLATRFKSSDFSMSLEYLTLTFPQGFIVDGTSSNILTRSSLEAVDGKIEIDFTIDGYTTTLTNNGSPINIGGAIECDIAPSITISGTTSGVESSSDQIYIGISSDIEVSDMTLSVTGVEVPISGVDNLGEAVKIDLDEQIIGVSSIALADSSNSINIAISKLEDLPSGLSANQGNYLTLQFPVSRFTLVDTASDDITLEDDSYNVNIPLTDIVGGNGYSTSIQISKIWFAEADFDSAGNCVNFDPQISLAASSVNVEGVVKLSEFEAFAESKHSITTTILADDLEIESADITIDSYSAALGAMTSSITQSESIPSEVSEIHSMTFVNDVYINLNIAVAITGTSSDLSFDNYTIEFPKFINIDDASVSSDNVLVLNDKFTHSGETYTFSKKIKVESFDFTDSQYDEIIEGEGDNKLLVLDEAIKLDGGLTLAAGSINSGSLSDAILANVEYSIDAITIDKIYGVIDPEIPVETKEIDLSSFVETLDDSLGDSEIEIELSNPVITITATNSLDIPIVIDYLELLPSKGGEALATVTTGSDNQILINPAINGVAQTTEIYISAEAVSGGSSNIQYVTMPDLKNLLAGLPDKIEMSYSASSTIIDDQSHMIDLNRAADDPYYFNLAYAIEVPLTFDSLNLDYSVVIEDIGSDLGDVFEMISTLELELTVENTLPIDLNIVDILPLDSESEVITALGSFIGEGSNTTIASGETSQFTISISDNAAGDLSLLDNLDIALSATIASGGATLNSNQYVQLSIVAHLPNGINVNLNE